MFLVWIMQGDVTILSLLYSWAGQKNNALTGEQGGNGDKFEQERGH